MTVSPTIITWAVLLYKAGGNVFAKNRQPDGLIEAAGAKSLCVGVLHRL